MAFRYLIGAAMRGYRRSPFYPGFGRTLARLLWFITRPKPGQKVVCDVKGIAFELELDEMIDSSLYYAGTYEAETEATILSLLKPGMIVLDVGANIGCHTFGMARAVGPKGMVYAAEPTPRAFAKLQKNASLNSFQNLRLLNIALGAEDRDDVTVTIRSSYRVDGDRVDVPAVMCFRTLDRLVQEWDVKRLDFIKIDTDGFEGRIFAGGGETIKRFRPAILFEFGPSALRENGDDPMAILQMFQSLKYCIRAENREPITDLRRLCERVPKKSSVNLLVTPN